MKISKGAINTKNGIISTQGEGFFHNKGTWRRAAHKGVLFRASSQAKGMLFGNFGQRKVKFC